MIHQNAATGSERQPFDVLVLRKIGANAIGGGGRGDVHVAHRLAADIPGSREVALHQRRRHAENVGDVIEAAALVVGRQQRGGVHIQPDEIVDGVGVFGAVQPVHGGVPGIGFCGGRAIERGLEIGRQSVECRCVRARHPLRRHGAGAQLANHLLPGLRRGRHVAEVGALERKPARAKFIAMAGGAVSANHGLLRGGGILLGTCGLSDNDNCASSHGRRPYQEITKYQEITESCHIPSANQLYRWIACNAPKLLILFISKPDWAPYGTYFG